MASTDPHAVADAALVRRVEYLVPDWVRVREEDFGLIFYDVRSAKLTFVRSGQDLTAPSFFGRRRVLGVREVGPERRTALWNLLQNLLAKGLIVAFEAD